ncbi:hypothetical protein [Falsiroseomonas tokyonensis]|uniref:Poly A polymerase head domain-containing protein n=1 Tax=Falsiroseomonas tokyonensis TaxID=430521 RepID=A0ABV7BX18_9PROT|nr:hypothetical protein [Falsiroseomonas tokyonensis]MBU8540203.1 hypothetical protein [Falsiroseomonas tokyonensis]
MGALTSDDMHRILTSMPKDAVKMLKDNSPRLFLAGGSIRAMIAGESVSDWDFFGPTKEALELAARRLADAREPKGKLYKTKNAFTVLGHPRTPVQFISRWLYDDPAALLQSFDFSVARAVIWWDGVGWQSLCDALFYPDLAAKRLRYMQPDRNEDAGGSMLRVQKFLHRGYHIAPESLGRVMARITTRMRGEASPQNAGEPDEAWHGRVITGLLRQVDPLTVVDGLEMRGDDDDQGEEVTAP